MRGVYFLYSVKYCLKSIEGWYVSYALLGAMALRLRGAEVYGLDIVDEASTRPPWLRSVGGIYVDARVTRPGGMEGMEGMDDLGGDDF